MSGQQGKTRLHSTIVPGNQRPACILKRALVVSDEANYFNQVKVREAFTYRAQSVDDENQY